MTHFFMSSSIHLKIYLIFFLLFGDILLDERRTVGGRLHGLVMDNQEAGQAGLPWSAIDITCACIYSGTRVQSSLCQNVPLYTYSMDSLIASLIVVPLLLL
jgi:hypothetical protein